VNSFAVERGENLLVNGGFESAAQWEGVQNQDGVAIDDSVAHSGVHSLRMSGNELGDVRDIHTMITLDPPVSHPFLVSGFSRAKDAAVEQDYNIYLDVFYADGTPLWGQKVDFAPGTHDWQYAEYVFEPTKSVKSIDVHVLFRKAKGTVWFDDVNVCLQPFVFKDIQISRGLFGNGLGVRMGASFPASWSAELFSNDKSIAAAHGEKMPVYFLYSDRVPGNSRLKIKITDALLHQTITREVDAPVSDAANQPFATWATNSMERVMPYALPDSNNNSTSATIDIAGNESESFQIALIPKPGQPLRGVRLVPSDLICAQTGKKIGAENIKWQEVGYVRIGKVVPHPGDPSAYAGWWPDPLLSVASFDAVDGMTNAIWVTVCAPAGTPEGIYTGTAMLEADGVSPTTVSINVRAYGFDLPVEGHLKTAFALMDGFLERVYGKPLDEKIRIAYGDFMLAHRLNPDDISRTSMPVVSDLEHFAPRGLNAFNVLNMVKERGDAPWVCFDPLSTYTPEFKQHILDRLDPYFAELRKLDLAKKAYIYTFDERGEDYFPTIRDFFGAVKERYPEVHTMTTSYMNLDPAFLDDLHVDWACPLTPGYNYQAAERCRAAGHQVWAYICMGPRYPYANILCDHPLIESRVLWWQAFQQKMDGVLYWGMNIWDLPHNDAPIDPAKGPLLDWSVTSGEFDWLHGDGRLLYAGKDGPIGCIRLQNIRDGLEDYEYLHLLAQKAGSTVADGACLDVTTDLTHFTRDPGVLCDARQNAAKRICAFHGE
jgi:hypothetical protein